MLLLGARVVAQAARDRGQDREALLVLARRWEALARSCMERHVELHRDAFRAFREQGRDHD